MDAYPTRRCCLSYTSTVINNFVVSSSVDISYILLHYCIPLIFFVYLCFGPCRSRKKKTVAYFQADQEKNGIQTARLQTAPPSTRVSLPSNTAEHAPNLLSPSGGDTSEVSPLLA